MENQAWLSTVDPSSWPVVNRVFAEGEKSRPAKADMGTNVDKSGDKSVLWNPPVEHPTQELAQVTGLPVPATATHLQRRQCGRQLHPGEALTPTAGDRQDLVTAVGVDGDGVVLPEVPTVLVSAHQVTVQGSGLQRHGGQPLRQGLRDEVVDQHLCGLGLEPRSLLAEFDAALCVGGTFFPAHAEEPSPGSGYPNPGVKFATPRRDTVVDPIELVWKELMLFRTTGRVGISVAGAILLLLSACGSGAVPQEDVEQQVSNALAESVGQTPDEVDCPEDLPAEVGAEMRCTLTVGGESIGLTVTVTSVEGNDVNFDILVDEQ